MQVYYRDKLVGDLKVARGSENATSINIVVNLMSSYVGSFVDADEEIMEVKHKALMLKVGRRHLSVRREMIELKRPAYDEAFIFHKYNIPEDASRSVNPQFDAVDFAWPAIDLGNDPDIYEEVFDLNDFTPS